MRSRPPPSLGLFVGRERELGRLVALRNEPLLTVRGTAGIGKTRLVAEHLRRTGAAHVLVELADIDSVEAMEGATWRALGVSDGATRGESTATLLTALEGRCLVLDNFEQLLPRGAQRIAAWLAADPNLRVLVTSRAELGIPGEFVVELGSLSTADSAGALASESAQLMLDRVARARDDYRVDGAEIERLGKILDALEGVPLAIEIVAPRLARFGAEAVGARLSERMRWRGSGGSTLGDALAASWDLLEPNEQFMLRCVTVFRGGFDLEAAEALVSAEVRASVMELLDALASKSFLQVSDRGSTQPGGRFDLLVSVREWVTERVDRQEAAEIAARHAEHFANRSSAVRLQLRGPEAAEARRWLSRERENLLCAARTLLGAPDDAARCVLALQHVATSEGPLAPFADEVTRLLERNDASLAIALELRVALAHVLQKLGRIEEAALAAAQACEAARTHPSLEPAALYARGCIELAQGNLERAVRTFEEGLAAASGVGDRVSEGSCCASMGAALAGLGEFDRARASVERARAVHVELGDLREEAMASAFLGNLCIDEGRFDEGELHFAFAMAIVGEIGDHFGEAFIVANLAMLHHRAGALQQAVHEYGAGIDGFMRVGARRYVGAFEGYRALAEYELGEASAEAGLERAAEHLTAARDARFAAFFEAMHGAIELARGEHARAAERIESAAARLLPTQDPLLSTAVSLARARLEEALGREANARGDALTAAAHRDAREALVERASRPDESGRTPEQSSFEVYLARRVCLGAAWSTESIAPPNAELSIAVDGAWIAAPSAMRVHLGHRPSLKQMLAALVAARAESPGQPISRETLQAAGWPGERIRPAAAANRVRVGIATLRRLGLRDVLRTVATGWLLDPDASLRVSTQSSEGAAVFDST